MQLWVPALLALALVLASSPTWAYIECADIKGYRYEYATHSGDDLKNVTSLKSAVHQCGKSYQCAGFIWTGNATILKTTTSPVTADYESCLYTKVPKLPYPRVGSLSSSCKDTGSAGYDLSVTHAPVSTPDQDKTIQQAVDSTSAWTAKTTSYYSFTFVNLTDCLKLEACITQTGNFYETCGVPNTTYTLITSEPAVIPQGRFKDLLDAQESKGTTVVCPLCEYKFVSKFNQFLKTCCPANKPKCCGSACCKATDTCVLGMCCAPGSIVCPLMCAPKGSVCCGFTTCPRGQKCCGGRLCVPAAAPCPP